MIEDWVSVRWQQKQNKKQGNEHAQLNIQYSPILMNIYNIGFSSFTITEGTFSPHMDTQTRPHRWSNLCMLHEYRQLHHNSEDFMVFKQCFNHNWSLMLCQSMPAFISWLSNTYDLSLACIMIICLLWVKNVCGSLNSQPNLFPNPDTFKMR